MRFLKIENQGVSDIEAILTMGVSTTRYSDNDNKIGMFGSGAKWAICTFLREGLTPIWYLGNLKVEFKTQLKQVKNIKGESRSYHYILAEISGKDSDGRQVNKTRDLGFTTDLGGIGWTIDMALREIVCNAIDASYEMTGSKDGLQVETVNDSSVRARAGFTRFFIEYNSVVGNFYQKMDENFLIFSSDKPFESHVIPKRTPGPALIYRRGVKVAVSPEANALFDYNLRDVEIDESRNVNRYTAESACAALIKVSQPTVIADFIRGVYENDSDDLFENKFSTHELSVASWQPEYEQSMENWRTAFEMAFPSGTVATNEDAYYHERIQRKGFKPLIFKNTSVLRILSKCEAPTYENTLSKTEINGHEISPPTEEMETCLNKIWCLLEDCFKITDGKSKPEIFSFTKLMDGGATLHGYQINDSIYISRAINGSPLMTKVIIEEVAHHITGSTDLSRDFQDFAFRLASEMAEFILSKKEA